MNKQQLLVWERLADTKLEKTLIKELRKLIDDNADLRRQVRDLEELLRREEARG